MKDNYDFSNGKKNPFAKELKKQISINISNEVIDYFKMQAAETGIPYQTLINIYLKDCAVHKRKPVIDWV